MSRVIHVDNPGKRRNAARRSIAEILRYLSRKGQIDDEARDMAAALVYLLTEIKATVDESAAAWEKRGYWVKADRFRMEWLWTGSFADKMKTALLADDWGTIAMLMPQIAQKFSKIVVSENHRLGKPWVGSYGRLNGKA